MFKKRLSVFWMLLIFMIIPFCYVELKKVILEKKVEEYLVNEKGYSFQEIKSIDGSFSKLPVWSVSVVFEDERNLIYRYKIESNEVEQYTVSTAKDVTESFQKTFIKNEIKLKHCEEK